MAEPRWQLLADRPDNPGRMALMDDGQLVDIWLVPPDPVHGPGSVHLVRLDRIFTAHNRATARLPDGQPISFRLPRSSQLAAGQLAFVTLTAEAASGKPLQASFGIQLAGRYMVLLPAEPPVSAIDNLDLPAGCGIIWRRQAKTASQGQWQAEANRLLARWDQRLANPDQLMQNGQPGQVLAAGDLLEEASLALPATPPVIREAGDFWPVCAEAALAALEPEMTTRSGFLLHFGQTRALTAIDVDSAASQLAASDRLEEITAAVMAGLRLRRVAGLVMLDMPRMTGRQMTRCLDLLARAASADPRNPQILGVGPAGLIELSIRRQRQPLDQTGLAAGPASAVMT